MTVGQRRAEDAKALLHLTIPQSLLVCADDLVQGSSSVRPLSRRAATRTPIANHVAQHRFGAIAEASINAETSGRKSCKDPTWR